MHELILAQNFCYRLSPLFQLDRLDEAILYPSLTRQASPNDNPERCTTS
jgi:hypothetical protein